MTDALVIGSGPGGVHAAAALLERGLSVALLDYGNEDETYAPLVPRQSWSRTRLTDPQQHRYFLGDRFEGIPLGAVRVGAQLTPPRTFITRDVERELPVDSPAFAAMESLATGGLAAGWGAGVFPYDDGDLEGTTLTRAELEPHYRAVAASIGVSGGADDLTPLVGELPALRALEIDAGAERVLARYERARERWRKRGFALGVSRLAVCTEEHRGRGPHEYLDMDFWADLDRSVYRPRFTLEELAVLPGFERRSRRLALDFRETEGGVEVRARNADTGEAELHRARALVLAAGALGSARLVLRSFGLYGARLPLVCNPYSYTPVLNRGMLGRADRDRRHGLAQLTAVLRTDPARSRCVLGHYYSYRSLLLFKLLQSFPLGVRGALRILPRLLPALGIVGIHHEDHPSGRKSVTLRRGLPDRLAIEYELSGEERRRCEDEERRLLACFRGLGCVVLGRIAPGHGASIRYGGTLPISAEERPLTCDRDGLLRGTRAVHVADGSVFPFLPAKGVTFTLMANARRIGARLAERLA